MSWVKLDDGFGEHRKVQDLSDKAFRLHVVALCYCARNLTDGYLTGRAVRVVRAVVDAQPSHVRELCRHGLWVQNGKGCEVHDYLEYNPSEADVKEMRRQTAERVRKHRRNSVSNSVTNSVSNARPLPSPKNP